jgi:hypothetical protein
MPAQIVIFYNSDFTKAIEEVVGVDVSGTTTSLTSSAQLTVKYRTSPYIVLIQLPSSDYTPEKFEEKIRSHFSKNENCNNLEETHLLYLVPRTAKELDFSDLHFANIISFKSKGRLKDQLSITAQNLEWSITQQNRFER